MKKTKNVLIAILTLLTTTVFGQVSINFGVGYHTGVFGGLEGFKSETNSSGETTYTSVNSSLGGGLPITLGLGLGITDNIALDANIEYLMGRSVVVYEDKDPTSLYKSTISSTQIRFAPSLIFKNGNSGLYGRVGTVLDLGGKMTIEVENKDEPPFGSSTEKSEVTVKPSLGLVAGLGYNLNLSDKLTVFGELQGVAMGRSFKKQEVVEYSDDQGGTLDTQYPTTSRRETEYVDEYTTDGSAPDDSKPEQANSVVLPFNSFGLNIGVRFYINK